MAEQIAERTIGDIIRELRKKKGLTQEKLSENICVPATLSRIENGTQIPGRLTFHRLMERLDGSGFSYEEFLEGESLHGIQIENLLFRYLEYGIWDKGETLLLEYRKEMVSDTRSDQFLKFIMLMWEEHLRINDTEWLLYLREELEKLLKMTYSEYPGTSWQSFTEFVSDERRGAIVERNLYHIEKLLINNIAYTYIAENRYREAMQQYLLLRSLLLREDCDRSEYWNERIVYHNNIAVCEYKMENYNEAYRECNEAIGCLYKGCNIISLYHLIVNRVRIYARLNGGKVLYPYQEILNFLFSLLPEGLKTYGAADILNKAPYVIRFF